MRLTKLQRYTAYCIMLAEAENRTIHGIRTDETVNGLCSMFFQITDSEDLYYYAKKTLPELHWVAGREGTEHLRTLNDWHERADILQHCIKKPTHDPQNSTPYY